MPTYQYSCDSCGNQIEVRQRFSDDPLQDCPDCEQSSLRRVIFATGVIFKGSGWYKTDNRRDPDKTEAKAEQAKEKAAAKSESDGSEKNAAGKAVTGKAESSEKKKPAKAPAGAAAGG